jgi:predicted secreted protein
VTGLRRLVRSLSVLLPVLLCLALFPPVQAASFWSQIYGEEGTQQAFAIIGTPDGGYAVAGTTNSLGAGGYDFWLIKTDADGNVQWNKTYGSELSEAAFSLAATPDGGYVLAGVSGNSSDYLMWFKYPLYYGLYSGTDVWVVKTDAQGNQQWNKTYRGGNDSYDYNMAYSIIATSDSGYAFCGTTANLTNDVPFGRCWLVKIDVQGNMLWNSTFSSGIGISWAVEEAYALVQADDGGYAIAGNMVTSTELKFWLIKTDSSGVMQWNKTYTNSAIAFALTITTDGGYAVAGTSKNEDCMLVKTDEEGNMQWSHEYGWAENGRSKNDYPNAVIQTSDGGYVLAGEWDSLPKTGMNLGPWTSSRTEAYLVKTDASGNMQWNRTYGDDNSFESAYGVVEAQDGGYVLAGVTSGVAWLLKTDEFGVVPEHPSLLTLTLVITATLPLLLCKKRLLRKH